MKSAKQRFGTRDRMISEAERAVSPVTTQNITRTHEPNAHIILGKIMNKPRVFLRIAAILSRMNFSVLQYRLIPTEDPRVHDMTLVIEGNPLNLTAALKQIERLIDVLEVGKGFGHG